MHYSRNFITKLNNKEIDYTFPSQTHHHARFSVYADSGLLFETMPNSFIPESFEYCWFPCRPRRFLLRHDILLFLN